MWIENSKLTCRRILFTPCEISPDPSKPGRAEAPYIAPVCWEYCWGIICYVYFWFMLGSRYCSPAWPGYCSVFSPIFRGTSVWGWYWFPPETLRYIWSQPCWLYLNRSGNCCSYPYWPQYCCWLYMYWLGYRPQFIIICSCCIRCWPSPQQSVKLPASILIIPSGPPSPKPLSIP
jgi:hypothetical protein